MLPTRQGKCFFFVSNATVKLFFLFLIATSVFTGSPSALCVGSGFRGHLV